MLELTSHLEHYIPSDHHLYSTVNIIIPSEGKHAIMNTHTRGDYLIGICAGSLVPRPSEVINVDGLGTTVLASPITGDPCKNTVHFCNAHIDDRQGC